ncbi:MAG: hypothetical protein JRI23_21945 [Deltaproteobacteria bacterium]|jgi:hypothetical protein|nr:hypothetical protein [Deltaproteobacteria bacterium]MBW2534621.1 hypothetical protein [Deltaproteobacteria bacterium]
MKRSSANEEGRVLRLKLGYNPNSSSIGTIVFGMPAALLGLTLAFGATAALLSTGLIRRPSRPDGEGDAPSVPSEPPDGDGAEPR